MHTCVQYIRNVDGSAYRALELADMSQDGFSDYPDDIEDCILSGLGAHLGTSEHTPS